MRPQVGEVFQERYLILAQLGAGGMGSVYHATQIDADRDVALKLLHPDGLKVGDAEARFYREFKILSQLNHPNIMTMYGLALDEDSVPFAICEYLDGVSLRQLLLQGRLPWLRASKIAIQICHAMQYAHDQGILHRDLKPENVLIMQRPEPDFVKLIDFGLSRALASLSDSYQRITSTGMIVGSPQYLSPEQITGQAETHSDIYALGCLLFELISGKALFDAETPSAIIYKHLNENPSQRIKLLSTGTTVPPRLLQILQKMLEKKPEQRYKSMGDLAADLESVIENPLSKPVPEAGSAQSNLTKALLCSLAAVVLFGGAFAFMSPHKTQPVVLDKNLTQHRISKIGTKSDTRPELIGESQRLRVAGNTKRSIALLKKAIAAETDDSDPYWNYDLHIELGYAYSSAGDFAAAEQAFRTAAYLFSFAGSPKRVYAGCALAKTYDLSGDTKKAEQTFLSYIHDCEASGNIAAASIINAYIDYSNFLAAHKRLDEGYKMLQKALLYANNCAHGNFVDAAHDRATCESVTCTWEFYDLSTRLHKTKEGRRELDKTRANLHSTSVIDDYTAHAIQLYADQARTHGFDQEAIEMYQLLLKDCKINLSPLDAKRYEDVVVPRLAELMKRSIGKAAINAMLNFEMR